MNISVIIPSALRLMPGCKAALWLDRAVASVCAQSLPPAEVLIGLDPGCEHPTIGFPLPANFRPVRIRFVHGDGPGHQAACNACARIAESPLLAFLEDDDEWRFDHLAEMRAALDRHPQALFVTCSHQEVMPDGSELRPFHFATMSGWLLHRVAWLALGGVDPRWRVHHDNEFLARFASAWPGRRVHLCRQGEGAQTHDWLAEIAKACVLDPCLTTLTVRRTRNDAGVLGGCRADEKKARQSADEYAALRVLYGTHGW